MEIKGRRVLVTGASSGIGWEAARAFAAAGAEVVAVARRRERLAVLEDLLDGAATVLVADLAEPGAVERVAAAAGTIDVLVNNAGSEAGGAVWAVGDRREARQMFEVDLWAPLALIAALVPGMVARGAGAVVNVTSIRQVVAWPGLGHSAAAKAALAQATETLRMELDGTGVGVVEVIPGPVETAALGASLLLPGFVELLDGLFGTGTPEDLAAEIVTAVRDGHDRVLYPSAVAGAYDDPVGTRAALATAARERAGTTGDLVVGPDHPLVRDAKDAWERSR
ncbi:SDR family NAD(P)-dependent oxidoreductase [Actinomadura rayongensis]|uniref:SDR family NAD(P)-dependent oxidoreductase n=1 Tax=Actinomadura rayongensis TaxID=1429076 RepID=A0A6I4VZX1_9ACTN|nr:SDR family NAD(P)-dependent oxidoreductase [Actinomadura rayongensis]MXQ62721.1 SDR family NAD(P)-dependent oxidoreductase [Actinomadura rayongensis]